MTGIEKVSTPTIGCAIKKGARYSPNMVRSQGEGKTRVNRIGLGVGKIVCQIGKRRRDTGAATMKVGYTDIQGKV